MSAGRPLVVRRRLIDAEDRPAGDFAGVASARGLVPGFLTGSLGTYCFNTRELVIGLTYDDGPNPEHTPRILDVLAERAATATFFVMTPRAAQHPDIVRRIVAEGHELALHGRDHRWLPQLTTREAHRSVRDARRALEAIGGVRVRRYRPPYGGVTQAQSLALWTLRLESVIWSSEAVDYLHDEEAAIAARAAEGVFPGGIVLLHDDRADPETAEPGEELPHFDRADVLVRLLDDLDRRGYRARSVADLARRYQVVRSFSRERQRQR